jgi:hypothetical protein
MLRRGVGANADGMTRDFVARLEKAAADHGAACAIFPADAETDCAEPQPDESELLPTS